MSKNLLDDLSMRTNIKVKLSVCDSQISYDRRCSMTSSSDWQWLVSDWAELHNKDMNEDHLRASHCRTDVFYDCAVFVYLLTLLILPKPSQLCLAWLSEADAVLKAIPPPDHTGLGATS